MKHVVFGIAILMVLGCGRTKQQECSEVIAAYNGVSTAISQGVGDGTDPAVAEANAKAVEDASRSFAAVEVSDAALKASRDDLAGAFAAYVKFIRTMAGAVQDAKDPAKADAATKAIEGAQAETQQIMSRIAAGKQALMTACNATAE